MMISAGYGFRMAIVMQDIAQLEELYGRNTRVTTVSGSQTQVYKTPVVRPGQGIFAPRGWAPHYSPRPLRNPLEVKTRKSAPLATLRRLSNNRRPTSRPRRRNVGSACAPAQRTSGSKRA